MNLVFIQENVVPVVNAIWIGVICFLWGRVVHERYWQKKIDIFKSKMAEVDADLDATITKNKKP